MARTKKPITPAIEAAPPGITPEDREDMLISLAFDLAEQRLRDGTASNQLIAEIISRGSPREKLQREKLERENAMLKAKAEALEAQKHTDEIYKKALEAMRSYSGMPRYDDEFDEDYTEL